MSTSDDTRIPPAGGAEPNTQADTQGFQELISYMPPRIWFLTSNGQDMWCRRPYSFCFSTSEAAAEFAHAMAVDLELSPIGLDTKELLSAEGLEAMRTQQVTRIFIDPTIDPASGEVFGKILRLAEMN